MLVHVLYALYHFLQLTVCLLYFPKLHIGLPGEKGDKGYTGYAVSKTEMT